MFWSIIASNKRKTVILIVLMGLFLILCGALIGMGTAGAYDLHAGATGAVAAAGIWIVMLLASLFASDSILLGVSRAHEVGKDVYPQLYNVVEEMVIAGSLPAMPRIFLVDDPAPNAFAMGKSPKKSCICVTAGLLAMCSRDELQGVVAHEIGHILNRDVLYMTVAATMLGSIIFVSDAYLRTFRYTSTARVTSRSKRGGKAAGALVLVSLVLAVLGPVFARILYFSISRRREYLADATSARLTRYPEGLASALEKIGGSPDTLGDAPSVLLPFYIANPNRQSLNDGIFATHPPLEERIGILCAMGQGAGYMDYMKAYIKVTRRHRALVPAADLRDGGRVAIRPPSEDRGISPSSVGESARRAGDIIRAMNGFTFITCRCGLRMKLPPGYPGGQIVCPRCKRVHAVPRGDSGMITSVLGESAAMSAPAEGRVSAPQENGRPGNQEVRIAGGKWQQFSCDACGRSIEVSPRFGGRKLKCSSCGSVIRIVPAGDANEKTAANPS
ncbi:MAG TPA: M48 family metallopeptidase [Deltaproteobacteria bacterium]|jgi:heat shock protein HtpX|nr:M48 family metallopeptidase [Deltaproteobacteria bacterium]